MVRETDQWKQIAHVKGGFRKDARLQMGLGAAVHSQQRLRIFLILLVSNAAIAEVWGLHKAAKVPEIEKLAVWCADRPHKFDQDSP